MDKLHDLFMPLASIAKEKNNERVQQGGANSPLSVYIWYLIHLLISVLAVYLSWECTISEGSKVVRVLYAVIAFLFSYIYIIYYVIYRLLMDNKCGIKA